MSSVYSIAHFANTIVGKPGNIGVRTDRILREIERQNLEGYCLSRKSIKRYSNIQYRDMGWIGQIPRLLNAMRIYAAPKFNHRYYDIKLFEWYAKSYLNEALSYNASVFHVWDTAPGLINSIKLLGKKCILDLPIAPTSYAKRISQKNKLDFISVHDELISIERKAFDAADIIVAPSKFVAEQLEYDGVDREKIRVIEFGVDLPNQSVVESKEALNASINYVFVGNVNMRKGISTLIDAWDMQEFKNDKLHLCGRVFPEVNSVLNSRNGGKIVLPGFVNTIEYLMNCDVFVFPSWFEGSAKAVYEAMACGLPVIVSESAGSIARDGIDGFVIKAGDYQGLREKMIWFKRNPSKIAEMGGNARERVKEYTWECYAKRVVKLYDEVI